jgi:hypothetical protein
MFKSTTLSIKVFNADQTYKLNVESMVIKILIKLNYWKSTICLFYNIYFKKLKKTAIVSKHFNYFNGKEYSVVKGQVLVLLSLNVK